MKMNKSSTVTKALRYKGVVAGLAGVILLAVLYYMTVQNLLALEPCQNTAVILLDDSTMTRKEALAVAEAEKEQENPYTFTAWTQEEEVTVQNRELNRSCVADAVEICGRSDILMQGSTWLDEEDTEGCLIDEKTAAELFGSTAVEGMKITIKEKERTIRGILYGVSDVIVFEAEELTPFTALQVVTDSGIRYEEIKQEFMMRNSLTGRFLKTDLLYQAGSVLALLIPLCAGGSILWQTGKKAWIYRDQKDGIICGAVTVLGIAVLLWFVIQNLEIPRDMIPTKWSDFDFWKTWWESMRESVQLLFSMPKQKPQEHYFCSFYLLACCSMLGIFGKNILLRPFRT